MSGAFRLALCGVALWLAAAAAAAEQVWDFDVFLDDKPIGSHRFGLRDDGARRLLSSDAQFNVKLLFINAYSYSHQSREVWDGDCLVSLDTSTDDDGERYSVKGERSDANDAFLVRRSGNEALSARESLPACVMTFAYWNPAMLRQTRLLNVQDGDYVAVDITPLAPQTVSSGGVEMRVDRYRLTAPDVDMELWYSADGDWRYLKSLTPEGYEISYRRR